MSYCAVRDEDIYAPIVDYSRAYPNREAGNLGFVSYAELKSGTITVKGRKVPTASLSSYAGAREIALTLKEWIREGKFTLTRPAAPLPSVESGIKMQPLLQRDPDEGGF